MTAPFAAEAAARRLRLKPPARPSLQRQSFRRAATSVASAALLATRATFARCPDGSPPPCARARPTAPSQASIAVLPFANLSRDSADVYLAGGLTEELISRLGAVSRFRVPGRSVVERAQAAIADPQALARPLGVRYLVEGSVRRGGARLRVSAAGDSAAARSALGELDATTSSQDPALAMRGFYAAGLVVVGDRERALAVLEAIASSDLFVWYLRSPDLDPIRDDPRFQRIEAAARAAP